MCWPNQKPTATFMALPMSMTYSLSRWSQASRLKEKIRRAAINILRVPGWRKNSFIMTGGGSLFGFFTGGVEVGTEHIGGGARIGFDQDGTRGLLSSAVRVDGAVVKPSGPFEHGADDEMVAAEGEIATDGRGSGEGGAHLSGVYPDVGGFFVAPLFLGRFREVLPVGNALRFEDSGDELIVGNGHSPPGGRVIGQRLFPFVEEAEEFAKIDLDVFGVLGHCLELVIRDEGFENQGVNVAGVSGSGGEVEQVEGGRLNAGGQA